MSKQIQVRWDNRMGDDYDATVEALTQYGCSRRSRRRSASRATRRRKCCGSSSTLASEHGLAVNTTLTATFTGEEAEGMQLRLFGPPSLGAEALGIVADLAADGVDITHAA